jgi:hypothetical protein
MAQAAKNLEKAEKVIITGFANPQLDARLREERHVKASGCGLQAPGRDRAYIAYWLADGTLQGRRLHDVPGVGKLKVEPNTIRYDYEAEDPHRPSSPSGSSSPKRTSQLQL